MYRQVALDPEDRDSHRILWRNSPQEPLQHLRMTRVTHGIASSTFQSTRCLHEVAQLCGVTLCSEAIKRDFYADDFVSGGDDVATAELLIKNVIAELGKHVFSLRKWTSSNSVLVLSLPTELRETSDEAMILTPDYGIKTLGISCKPNLDDFRLTIDLPALHSYTKRGFLADVGRLFDPVG